MNCKFCDKHPVGGGSAGRGVTTAFGKDTKGYFSFFLGQPDPFALHIYPQGGHGLSTVDQWCNGDLSAAVLHAGDWYDAAIKWLSFTL